MAVKAMEQKGGKEGASELRICTLKQDYEGKAMNVLDLPTEPGCHQCGEGNPGGGKGSKGGTRTAKQKNADGQLGRSLVRAGVTQPTKGYNITRDRGSRIRTG